MEEVAASRSVLQCLLESQDFASSLELLGNLRHQVDRQLGLGIKAFKEIRPQVCSKQGRVRKRFAIPDLAMVSLTSCPSPPLCIFV